MPQETAATDWVSGSELELALGHQLVERQLEGHEAARDGRAARAAVGLQHVAVHVDRALAEGLEVDHAAQRAADQALDLHGAAVRAPLRHVALLALAGGRGQHPVLGRDPAAALAGHPARHVLLGRGGADHARAARLDQRRAGGGAHEAGVDRDRAQVARVAAVVPHATALSSPSSTCRTSPSGIWRKRVPTRRNSSVSPRAEEAVARRGGRGRSPCRRAPSAPRPRWPGPS